MDKSKLKVWGGTLMIGGKQVRGIVATQYKKQALEILRAFNIGPTEFKNHWCATGNSIELETALAQPGKVFASTEFTSKEFYLVKDKYPNVDN